jgi:hypothetical protein
MLWRAKRGGGAQRNGRGLQHQRRNTLRLHIEN